MTLTHRMIREELHREVANLPIPADMWERINDRLDDLPEAAPILPRKQNWLNQRRAVVAVAAAGFFWLTMVPATRLADQHPARPAVAVHRAATAADVARDSTGPYRSAPVPFVPHTLAALPVVPSGHRPAPLQ